MRVGTTRIGLLLIVTSMLAFASETSAVASGVERVGVDTAGNQGDKDSSTAAMSADGRFVAFVSSATNLVVEDTNQQRDIFVHDRQTGITERVSVAANGDEADGESLSAAISGDGRYVAFSSSATNMAPGVQPGGVDLYVHDRADGSVERVSVDADDEGLGGNHGSDNTFG